MKSNVNYHITSVVYLRRFYRLHSSLPALMSSSTAAVSVDLAGLCVCGDTAVCCECQWAPSATASVFRRVHQLVLGSKPTLQRLKVIETSRCIKANANVPLRHAETLRSINILLIYLLTYLYSLTHDKPSDWLTCTVVAEWLTPHSPARGAISIDNLEIQEKCSKRRNKQWWVLKMHSLYDYHRA